MTPYPPGWREEQRRRFANTSALLGVQGLWDKGRFVHVAGTNGKGSVCAFLGSILRAAGYRVGVFTSPHLFDETERITVDGENIPRAELDELMHESRGRADELLPGVYVDIFEHYMYAALKYFERQAVDVAVIEAGIGGGMDCTSIIKPDMCVCCTIGLEHTELLGGTLEQIALQKAGICKPGVPLVLYPLMQQDIRAVIQAECERLDGWMADGLGVDSITMLGALDDGENAWPAGQAFGLDADGLQLENARIRLLGGHQAYNAATAAYAAWLLNGCGYGISPAHIAKGLWKAEWPGRMQLVSGEGKADMLLDGAHNPEALAVLLQAVREYFPKRKIAVLTAVMRDKNVGEMAAMLRDYAREGGHGIVCTCAKEGRGLPAAEFAALCGTDMFDERPAEALAMASRVAGDDGLVLVCGSLYLPHLLIQE